MTIRLLLIDVALCTHREEKQFAAMAMKTAKKSGHNLHLFASILYKTSV